MVRSPGGFLVGWTAVLALSASVGAQTPTVTHPILAGTWTPADPAKSDQLFAVGLGTVPGAGQVMIEQRPNRLTVTISIPDNVLDPLLDVTSDGRYYKTVIYRMAEPRGRAGGAGAGGAGAGGVQPPSVATWLGDKLVISNARPAIHETISTLSLDNDRLTILTELEIGPGRVNRVTELFTRAK